MRRGERWIMRRDFWHSYKGRAGFCLRKSLIAGEATWRFHYKFQHKCLNVSLKDSDQKKVKETDSWYPHFWQLKPKVSETISFWEQNRLICMRCLWWRFVGINVGRNDNIEQRDPVLHFNELQTDGWGGHNQAAQRNIAPLLWPPNWHWNGQKFIQIWRNYSLRMGTFWG